MRQIWVEKAGDPEVLQVRETPDPTPRTGEVRIRVAACGVNFMDVLGRAGLVERPQVPFVPGLEVSGRIDMVGQGIAGLKEGDEVMALVEGGYSDVVCVPYKRVYRRLAWMSAEDGAALPVSYLSAYLMLVRMGSLRPGDRVLIHNVGGSLGLAALDICLIVGAEAYGTASPEKHEMLRERGLQEAINYRKWDYERIVNDLTNREGVDLVLDSLGGNHWRKNYRLLRPAGRLICCGLSSLVTEWRYSLLHRLRAQLTAPAYRPLHLMEDNKAVIGFDLRRLWEETELLRAGMEQLINWYDEALFRPHIHQAFSFARAAEAHRTLEQRRNLGKVLLMP